MALNPKPFSRGELHVEIDIGNGTKVAWQLTFGCT
jgi:hypothetical protein